MKPAKFVGTAVLLFLFGTAAFAYAKQEEKGEKPERPEKQSEPAQQKGQQQEQRPAPQPRAQQQPAKPAPQQHAQQQQEKPAVQQRAQQPQEKSAPQQHAQQQQEKPVPQQRAQQQQQKPNPPQHAAQQKSTRNTQQVAQRPANQPVQQRRSQQQEVSQQGQQRGEWQQRRAHNFDTEHRTWQQRGGYTGYRIPDAYFSSYYGSGHSFRVYDLPFMEVGGFPRFQYGGYWFSVVDPYPEFWGADWYQTDNVYVMYVDNGYYLYDSSYPGRPGVAISISL
jgi:hypothetical protein